MEVLLPFLLKTLSLAVGVSMKIFSKRVKSFDQRAFQGRAQRSQRVKMSPPLSNLIQQAFTERLLGQ